MAQKNDKYTYRVTWSEEDNEYIGLCAEFPSLSWLADTPEKALKGIRKTVAEVISATGTGEFRIDLTIVLMEEASPPGVSTWRTMSSASTEVVALCCEILAAAGLEDFQVNLGHTSVLREISSSLGLDEGESARLRASLARRDIVAVE
ncbi:MAG: ATP phosphoribosyltransferase regulatory subunit, partial [Desulfobacterales bacterium]